MTAGFNLEEYDYDLPSHLIAQYPLADRSSSRMMVIDRSSGRTTHRYFTDFLDYIGPDDCLVLNDSKVFPARIKGLKHSGGKVEIFLLGFPRENGNREALARALYRGSKPARPGQRITCQGDLEIEVLEIHPDGQIDVRLMYDGELFSALKASGQVPLPPYIKRSPVLADVEQYQTVYAREIGSVAAPTAGFHFTREQLELAEKKGVKTTWITLHVGYGTFAPVRSLDIRKHRISSEWLTVPESAVKEIEATRKRGRRVIAVGTTTVRALETTANGTGRIKPFQGPCDLYILPGHCFQAVDALITNFHLPESSLLILASAFAGRERILSAYREAVESGYRFYSYGDAMFIV